MFLVNSLQGSLRLMVLDLKMNGAIGGVDGEESAEYSLVRALVLQCQNLLIAIDVIITIGKSSLRDLDRCLKLKEETFRDAWTFSYLPFV
jgi:hypothetical protein